MTNTQLQLFLRLGWGEMGGRENGKKMAIITQVFYYSLRYSLRYSALAMPRGPGGALLLPTLHVVQGAGRPGPAPRLLLQYYHYFFFFRLESKQTIKKGLLTCLSFPKQPTSHNVGPHNMF